MDYQSDSDYPEYRDESPESSPSEVDTNDIASPAYFDKAFYTLEVNPGDNVILHSYVRNWGKKNMVIWYNRTLLLIQGSQVVRDKERLSLEDRNLVIKNVQISDDNDYICKLLPESLTMVVSLHVKSPPRNITIIYKDNNVSTKTLHLKNGETAFQLHCSAEKGRPNPSITWSKDVSKR